MTTQSNGLKADTSNVSALLENPIPVLTEDEKMNARMVIAGRIAPADGLADVLGMLGLGPEKLEPDA